MSRNDSTLDLSHLPGWLIERGLEGPPLTELIAGFCNQIHEAGFPAKRVQMGLSTLHPRYGSHTFIWRPDGKGVVHTPRERAVLRNEVYLKSPVHFMRSRGLVTLRRRIDAAAAEEFPVFGEMLEMGLVDYAAHVVPYNREQLEAIASERAEPGTELDGIFFSCATDRVEGFEEADLEQVFGALPYLALSMKSRLTYDVAGTVLGTYLGGDAGHRVLSGAIERGSATAIRAIIWFSDLRGFTRLTDSLPRDALVETLDAYLEAMAGPVQDHSGQILKIMGDGLLATFDLTGRDEAAVCREALAAAAALTKDFPAFNAAREEAGKPTMDFGLALHLGEVFYGNIGANDRLDFTVIGPAVNEASRIQALCKELERRVLVSSTFRESAGGEEGLESLGQHTLRGVRMPQELFGLVG